MNVLNFLAMVKGDATNVIYTCELPPAMAEKRRLEATCLQYTNSPGYSNCMWKVIAVQKMRKRIAELS